MKKIISLIITVFVVIGANAQTLDPLRENVQKYEMITSSRLLITIALFAIAILIFIKLILEFSIKSKLIEKDASDTIVSQLLQHAGKDDKQTSIKWFAILAGIGIGL